MYSSFTGNINGYTACEGCELMSSLVFFIVSFQFSLFTGCVGYGMAGGFLFLPATNVVAHTQTHTHTHTHTHRHMHECMHGHLHTPFPLCHHDGVSGASG